MAKLFIVLLFLCYLIATCFPESKSPYKETKITLMLNGKKETCENEHCLSVMEGDTIIIDIKSLSFINKAWCEIGNMKYDITNNLNNDYRRTANITASLQMSQKWWNITLLTNENTSTGNIRDIVRICNSSYLPSRLKCNVTVNRAPSVKANWIYVATGFGVALLFIVAEAVAIIYYKKKGSSSVSRLERVPSKEDTTKANSRARYIISPGLMGLLTRKDKKERNKDVDDDTGSLYETLEAVALGASDAPAPPPITTLPNSARKFLGVPSSIEAETEKKSPTKKNSKEADIKSRPPLPLPNQEQNKDTPRKFSFISPIKQKSTLSEKSTNSNHASLPTSKSISGQDGISQELNDILKTRSDSVASKAQLKSSGSTSRPPVNRKPIITKAKPNPPVKSKPKPPVKKPDVAPKSLPSKTPMKLIKNTESPAQPGPSHGQSVHPIQSTLHAGKLKTTASPAPIRKPPLPIPIELEKVPPPVEEIEEPEQEVYSPWDEDWTYEPLDSYNIYSNLGSM
ncbi:nascent polypeptide-associated complex subunit alpha, muscle-specific form-like [Achroia grisella]|uniref:nascent polypeptide-associated complex subunit alpha, muscle-specific form-like n=1 Tax=Achroia grisella TaxID=688607 RepID=UPI0027D2185C|nr:nascent polypeptide-associated complex subunit alpha, muscle-specific form-like [Achroia grisella]